MLGALTTDIGPWYFNLHKPLWQPPHWLFGPARTLTFALAAFAGNAFLNTLWSLLFFRMRRPDWALYEVGLLWLSILVLIILLSRRSRAAAWLLAPYLAWVSFASFLNFTIVRLNAPFPPGG